MRILVTASRSHEPRIVARRIIEWVERNVPTTEKITLIHGDAEGGDQGAELAARLKGWNVWRFPISREMWAAEPRRAGVLRNLEMLEMQPHTVIGFPLPAMYDASGNFVRDRSKGTRHMLKAARDAHVPKIVEWNIPRGTRPDHDGEWKEQA